MLSLDSLAYFLVVTFMKVYISGCWNHCNEGQDDEYCHTGLCDKVKLCAYTTWKWEHRCDQTCDGRLSTGTKKQIIDYVPSWRTVGCHIDRFQKVRNNDTVGLATGYSASVNGKRKWVYAELRKYGFKCTEKIVYPVPCNDGPCQIPKPRVHCGDGKMVYECSGCGSRWCEGSCKLLPNPSNYSESICVPREECKNFKAVDELGEICKNWAQFHLFFPYCWEPPFSKRTVKKDGHRNFTMLDLCKRSCLRC